MRVPAWLSLLLCLLLVGGLWWWRTRTMDFLTPPADTPAPLPTPAPPEPPELQVLPVQLHASSPSSRARILEAALSDAATLLRETSGGLLSVEPRLTFTTPPPAPLVPPLALWLTGPGGEPSTPVLSARPPAESAEAIRDALLAMLYKTIRAQLRESRAATLPELPASGAHPAAFLRSQVPPQAWKSFGHSLQP